MNLVDSREPVGHAKTPLSITELGPLLIPTKMATTVAQRWVKQQLLEDLPNKRPNTHKIIGINKQTTSTDTCAEIPQHHIIRQTHS